MGALSGYRGQVDLSKTDHGTRASEDSRLLVYTSEPLKEDMEITSDPIAHVRLTSSATDGLLIIYLEDVAPNKGVTYITQGALRLAFRKTAVSDDSAYSSDPLHTYRRADMSPTKPGRFENVLVGLAPIAALVHKQHRQRIASAGADNGNLERLLAVGNATLNIAVGSDSYVEVPRLR
ncbi:MAG TPA: CocE/NonD family hydrolase C-terminal non-catalytic domain-containing protein [Steroidobacteraceae bacterium]